MIGTHFIRICFLAAISWLTVATAAQGQEPSGDVLTLDRAIELARANNRDTRRTKFEIDRQREASAEAKTSYYPRFDAYLLGTQLLGPLNFTIGSGQLGTYPSTGPIPGSDINLHTPARPIAIAQPGPRRGCAVDDRGNVDAIIVTLNLHTDAVEARRLIFF